MNGVDVRAALNSLIAAGCQDSNCDACAEIARVRDTVVGLIEKGDALMYAFHTLDKERGVAAALAFDRALSAAKGGR